MSEYQASRDGESIHKLIADELRESHLSIQVSNKDDSD